MWKPRVIALDLDGTVVGLDDTIPSDIRSAVRDAISAGIHVVVSTGRSWAGTDYHVDTLGLPPGPHVTSNGAVLVEYPPRQVVQVTTFEARPIIERVLAEHPHALVAVEDAVGGFCVNRSFPTGDLGGRDVEVPLEELWAEPVPRVVVRDPKASDSEFIGLAHRLGLEGVSYAVGYTGWLDIAPEGVNKAVGLATVTQRLGVDPRDVLALGDGRNDIQMLQWAGRGVALGDAPAEVQAAANAVTGRFSDGGTAAELRRWF